ncbi:12907_t:CDS:2 [Racocetra fulgida]|uniref:12907_t:CDS:1 n=1 Tax=Racocetra fulgida TaxID=60492 RepID=A0A9N8ZED4_9GLOM|nr:12907_t:CDS:2 [Racocetra fulgida]
MKITQEIQEKFDRNITSEEEADKLGRSMVDKIIAYKNAKVNSKNSAVNKQNIKDIINTFLEEINEALIKGEEVKLVGHFALKTVMTKEKQGINLKTKEKITIPAKRVPKIKFSPNLKKEISATK